MFFIFSGVTVKSIVVEEKAHTPFKKLCRKRGLKLGAVATQLIRDYTANENLRTGGQKAKR